MNLDHSQLTAAEMGELWAAYIGNTMGKCVLSYYLKHVDDSDIKNALEFAMGLCKTYIQTIEQFFNQTDFPIPAGFTDNDVNLEAPRLYKDEFYLRYLMYIGRAGMSHYTVAVQLVRQKNIRDFFVKCVNDTMQLLTMASGMAISKDVFLDSPVIPTPEKVNFVQNQKFLNSFFRVNRPLHGLEIAHIYECINIEVSSKALIVGFCQGTRDKKVREFLERGREINQKHIDLLTEKLSIDGLPAPTLLDHLVTTSTVSPFSDKLMVFHKVDSFSMKIRAYANGASINGRKDVGALYGKCLMEVMLYVEDGANLMIDRGWMEQPPENVDRDRLLKV